MASIIQNAAEQLEEWRVIKDYPNYEVSNMGYIRRNGKTIFKGSKSLDGYITACLSNNGKARQFKIHRLVADAFIPNPENKQQVNHLGAKDDNRVCMLEWATPSENSLHGAKKNRNNKHNKIISIAKVHKDTNEIIKVYKSIIDIQNDGYNYKKVRLCVKGQNHTHSGFKWKNNNIAYDNDNIKNIENQNLEGEIWRWLKDSIYNEINIYTKHQVSNYGRVKGINGKL